MYNTRIAPSPTGDFHLGTARTAYFNWLAARATGGKFILRVDDTDDARNVDGAVDVIYDCMDWLGLNFDAAFTQSSRLDRYYAVAMSLVTQGFATVADNGAVLLNWDVPTTWTDAMAGVMVANDNDRETYCNQVLLKGNGMPIYHFATVVDDIDSNINYVIRGADHFTNTHRHAAIYDALGANKPLFAHVGLIMVDKKKMSKRDKAASLLGYRDAGYSPEAVRSTLLRLGWGPTVDDKSTKFIDKDRAVTMFVTGGKMKANPATLDMGKMDYFNRIYKNA
jgi:glutamyl/glutaminyl-tRNA synthetase